jgi:integrase
VTAPLAAAPRPAARPAGDDLAALRAALRPDFLDRAGWEPAVMTLTPARADPLLGLRACAVAGCGATAVRISADLCQSCHARWKDSDLEWEEFLARPRVRRPRGDRPCRVPRCPRPGGSADGLCRTHQVQRERHPGLPLGQWLARPGVVPLPSFGGCVVASCAAAAAGRDGLCHAHYAAWYRRRLAHPGTALAIWARHASPASAAAHTVVLRGLPELVVAELLVGVQRRTDAGLRTRPDALRCLVNLLHARRAGSVLDLARVPSTSIRRYAGALLRSLLAELRRALSDPEREQAKDVWQLTVLGLPGTLDFTGLAQQWLREAAKRWAAEDLPLRRGQRAAYPARDTINALAALSECLRLTRGDHGDDPGMLGRADIIAFTNRLAHLERTGQMTFRTRLRRTRRVFRFFNDLHVLGMTGPGQPAAGLPAAFVVRRDDIPKDPDRDARPRSLPPAVLQAIAANLGVFEQRCGVPERRITELLIDTGRRPDEICALAWDCLERGASGSPVLIYTDSKNNRPGRRLPVSEATAAVITAQKDWVRSRYPDTPVGRLALFPRDKGNRDGTKPILGGTYTHAHRIFADAIAHLLTDADGQQIDPARVVPYAYRHGYAQRHADAGIAPDVLRELMSHRSMRTTTGYYRITETRTRAAVDRVARHQFDAAGRRVFHDITSLLADEQARVRVGQVAVPFGICTEPSNVKAGGSACPYRYVCAGCGHFRSDPSYLPELKSYLQQLLADAERLRATADLQPWARAHAAPPAEQISQVRELIRRIEADLDTLSDADRASINNAIATIRATRQTVMLGMPGTRPPAAEEPSR